MADRAAAGDAVVVDLSPPLAVSRSGAGGGTADEEGFISAASKHRQAPLRLVNRELVAAVQRRSPSSVATLDRDATLVECLKAAALYRYKQFKSDRPLNVWWAEQRLVLHSEFRDGNVPAGFEQLGILQRAEAMLPEGVRTARMRSDTAGYQEELLRYCEMGTGARFGRVEFAVSADASPAFKQAVAEVPESEWHPIRRTATTAPFMAPRSSGRRCASCRARCRGARRARIGFSRAGSRLRPSFCRGWASSSICRSRRWRSVGSTRSCSAS